MKAWRVTGPHVSMTATPLASDGKVASMNIRVDIDLELEPAKVESEVTKTLGILLECISKNPAT